VGGRVAGSNASDSTEIYQEGLRIPPLKMYDAGRRNDTLFALIEKNVRVPVKVFGDLRAQLAACHIAERQFLELVQRYGADMVQVYMHEVIDYAERLTRAAIRTLPDGVYSFEDWIDDDGIDVGQPIRLFVTLSKQGDSITADWTGSAAQVKGAIKPSITRCRLPGRPPTVPSGPSCQRGFRTTKGSSGPSRSLPRQVRLPMRYSPPPVRRAA
jgi:N-methylhydantoinase B